MLTLWLAQYIIHYMKVVDAIGKVAKNKKRFRTSDVTRELGGSVSRQYVSSELSKLYKMKKLFRAGSGQYVYYALPEYAYTLKNEVRKKLKNLELLFLLNTLGMFMVY